MNDLPRQKLIEIVTHRRAATARFGRDVVSDAKLCEALLRDLCGEHKREIFVLMAAQKEQVAADLLAAQDGVPRDVLLARLTRRLKDNLALTDEAARWAVESWALALGVLAPSDLKSHTPKINVSDVAAPSATSLTSPASSHTQASKSSHDGSTLALTPGVTMEFVRVAAGVFMMGSTKRDDEKPQHKVYLHDYLIGKYPVTVAQFVAFVSATGFQFKVNLDIKTKFNHPVTRVNWNDAMAFCQWAAKQTGLEVRLPAEAEWEKAARGTDIRTYPWSSTEPTTRLCNFDGNFRDTTPVGQYSPQGDSPYGCADMAGNVWEWCNDWYDDAYYAKSFSKNTGPISGQFRVLRGGAWVSVAELVRTSYRFRDLPVSRDKNFGFRCAYSLSELSLRSLITQV